MLNIPVAESEEGAPKLLIQWLSSGGKLIQNILNDQCEYFIDLPICRHGDLSGFNGSGVGFHVDCCGGETSLHISLKQNQFCGGNFVIFLCCLNSESLIFSSSAV